MSESPLADQVCTACSSNDSPMDADAIHERLAEVPSWGNTEVDGIQRLERTFTFPNFAEALAFTQAVGELAEELNHHPAILTEWGKVTVSWWTHKIKGLHQNDFIAAAKTSALYEGSC